MGGQGRWQMDGDEIDLYEFLNFNCCEDVRLVRTWVGAYRNKSRVQQEKKKSFNGQSCCGCRKYQ